MGLFDKIKGTKPCLVCGENTDRLHIRMEIEGGWMCRHCIGKMSPYIEQSPENRRMERNPEPLITVDEYRAHLAWREQCRELDAVFVPEERHDDPTNGQPLFEVDRTHGLFRVLRSCGGHPDVMRLADLRDVHPVVVEYVCKEGPQGETSTFRYYYFNMRIGMALPLMQRAEFPACAWYVDGGMNVGRREGGYRPGEKTTMKDEDMREYERYLAECQKLAPALTGQAGPPELRVVESQPSQNRDYPAGSMPKIGMFSPQIR